LTLTPLRAWQPQPVLTHKLEELVRVLRPADPEGGYEKR
jgi:hypothetical protein